MTNLFYISIISFFLASLFSYFAMGIQGRGIDGVSDKLSTLLLVISFYSAIIFILGAIYD